MQLPGVSNIAKDERRNITFDVRAFRTLTREELMRTVWQFEAMQKKKLKNNSVYRIYFTGLRH